MFLERVLLGAAKLCFLFMAMRVFAGVFAGCCRMVLFLLGCCKMVLFAKVCGGCLGSRLQNGVFLLGCKMVLFARVCGGCLSVFWATAANAAE